LEGSSKLNVTEGKPPLTIKQRIENATLRLQRDWRIFLINSHVKLHANPIPGEKPVAFFNASTRLGGFSQNAAFSLLSTWGIRLSNIPVVHFACHSGMSRCVLGSDIDDPYRAPPCEGCIAQTKKLLRMSDIHWFEFQSDSKLNAALNGLSVDELSDFHMTIDNSQLSIHRQTIPLGQLVLPALRWVLRRHHLLDDDSTRFLLQAFIHSAYSIAVKFDQFLDQANPQAIVIFNGIMFPEAVARWVAKKRNLRVITHEVGFQPFSAFFTEGQATAYPMQIPEEFDLSAEQNVRLDEYLSGRLKGEFTMAGIRFWPKISGLGADFLKKGSEFKQIVPVFTNVINDTSQVHASLVFSHMYDWLEHVVEIIRQHPETLFVIRAHPDEKRRGTRKHSRQPVSDWIVQNSVDQLSNVIFVDSNEPLSSYALIQKSKFVIVYNSSIGLEAVLLDVPVLCGGKARYTQYPTVFFPQTPSEYKKMAENFLDQKHIEIPRRFKRNARRVVYWQLYRSSLPFDRFIDAHPTPGYVQLKRFSWRDLLESNSTTMQVLLEGILNGEPLILPDEGYH
jgi:hypothetical protein